MRQPCPRNSSWIHPFQKKERTVLRIVLIRGCQCDSLWRSREGWLDEDEGGGRDERRQETRLWLRSRGRICRWRREMTGKNSCQTIWHHPARVFSSLVSLFPRFSPLSPLRWHVRIVEFPIRGRSMNLFVGETIISNNSRRNILENRVPSSKFNSSFSSPDPANLYSKISKLFSRTKETRERGEETERVRETDRERLYWSNWRKIKQIR